MTRRFLVLILFWSLAQIPLFAETTDMALAKSAILENDVMYLRVGAVGKNLADEISAAQSALAATNKTAGVVLDLRFADGDDPGAARATANLFASKKLPLAILVNGKTRGAAAKLALELREARAGLIFGSSTEVKPDIAVAVKMEDEKIFLENAYGTLSPEGTNPPVATNNFMPFVDHTSEADLVRARVKDSDEDDNSEPPHAAEPPKPFIRDPVLARAVDLIKGLAVVRQSRS